MVRLRRAKSPSRAISKRVVPSQGTSFVLDTTCFHGGTFGPQSPGFSKFFEIADDLGCRVILPEIVLREWARQARNNLRGWAKNSADTLAKYANMIGKPIPAVAMLTQVEKDADALEARFRTLLKKQGVVLAPIPTIDIDLLVRRDLANDPPFHEGRGFRDTLIWHTALSEVMAGQSVHFITNNKRDFGSETGLHANLAGEVSAIGKGEVSIHATIGAAISWLTESFLQPVEKLVGKPAAAALGDLRAVALQRRIGAAISSGRKSVDWLLDLPVGHTAIDTLKVTLGAIEKAAKLDGATFATIPFEAQVLSYTLRMGHRDPVILHIHAKVQVLVTDPAWEILGFIPGTLPKYTTGEEAAMAQHQYDSMMQEFYEDIRQDAEADARREWEELQRDSWDNHHDDR